MLPRRDFLHKSAATAACFAIAHAVDAAPAEAVAADRYQFCAFTKYLQSLEADALAAAVAGAGFKGVEAPVRSGGHFSMEEAADKLPPFVAALRNRGVEITILCTDLLRADQAGAERCLRTARELGIKRYRMGSYRYDLRKPLLPQLDEIGPALKDVAALNRELAMQAVYQNHSGADMVGATVWDIFRLIEDLPPSEVALAFDIRHATVEAGLAWPATFRAVEGHIGAVFVKDFQWRGRSAENVPLGKGLVDPKFFAMLAESEYAGPVSVHVEYIPNGDTKANAEALRNDLATLCGWMKA
jgi:sugar phosphate isomerase/epimerase